MKQGGLGPGSGMCFPVRERGACSCPPRGGGVRGPAQRGAWALTPWTAAVAVTVLLLPAFSSLLPAVCTQLRPQLPSVTWCPGDASPALGHYLPFDRSKAQLHPLALPGLPPAARLPGPVPGLRHEDSLTLDASEQGAPCLGRTELGPRGEKGGAGAGSQVTLSLSAEACVPSVQQGRRFPRNCSVEWDHGSEMLRKP